MPGLVHKPTLMFYRRLLKTMMRTFVGDYQMFHKMRIQAKNKIRESSQLTDPIDIQQKIFFGEQVRDFLQKNIMQGTVQPSGNIRFKARSQHAVSSALKDGTVS